MDNNLIALTVGLTIAITTITPAIGQGWTASKAVESVARQPEAAGDIRFVMILACAFLESLAIYGLLIAFMLLSKMS